MLELDEQKSVAKARMFANIMKTEISSTWVEDIYKKIYS